MYYKQIGQVFSYISQSLVSLFLLEIVFVFCERIFLLFLLLALSIWVWFELELKQMLEESMLGE